MVWGLFWSVFSAEFGDFVAEMDVAGADFISLADRLTCWTGQKGSLVRGFQKASKRLTTEVMQGT